MVLRVQIEYLQGQAAINPKATPYNEDQNRWDLEGLQGKWKMFFVQDVNHTTTCAKRAGASHSKYESFGFIRIIFSPFQTT
jgi:hypothetical protein